MKQLIINTDGSIVNYDSHMFKCYNSIFDFGFNEKLLDLTINDKQLLIINVFEKNYIIKNLKMHLNQLGLLYFIFDEYQSAHLNCESGLINTELSSIESYEPIEQSMIFAIRNGYLQDKEINQYIKNLCGIDYDIFKIQYIMKKLYGKFEVASRSELLRKIYLYRLDNFFPKDIFYPGIYNTKFKQLQQL